MKASFFDAFAGVGGFRLAFEREGFECVGWCEIDEWCQKLYRYYYEPDGEYFKADILAIDPRELPDFDIITAGIPCQPFSYAGKRRGLKDERGLLLWLAFFDIVRVKRPKVVLIENVRGLLSSRGGRDFAWVLLQMARLGYSVEWCVLNSKDFGVPQNRERVFVVGHSGGECPAKVFPLEEGDKIRYTPPRKASEEGARLWDSSGVRRATDANYGKGGGSRTHIAVFDPYNRRLPRDQSAVTALRTNDRNGNAWIVELRGVKIRIRKLTPLECFRLQGFPDDIVRAARKLGISDTQLYKMAGNAVTVPVAQSIARKLKKVVFSPQNRTLCESKAFVGV